VKPGTDTTALPMELEQKKTKGGKKGENPDKRKQQARVARVRRFNPKRKDSAFKGISP